MSNEELILQQLSDLKKMLSTEFSVIHKKFEQIDAKFEQIDAKFEQIDKKFEQIDKKFEQIDKKFEQVDKILSENTKEIRSLSNAFNNFRNDNIRAHFELNEKIEALTRLFTKFEVETNDKLQILFDADVDRREHQLLFARQINKLNDDVKSINYRLSILEKKNK